MTTFRPMLAATYNADKARWPLWASPKIDGIRCLINDGVALSRSLKPLGNEFVQAWAADHFSELQGLDGELIVGDPTDPKAFLQTTGALRRRDGEPDFTFMVFDRWSMPDLPYSARFATLPQDGEIPRVQLVRDDLISDHDELMEALKRAEAIGWEGLMLRDHYGLYKHGRATVTKQELIKVKTFVDAEFEIVAVHEEMENLNEATTNELGLTERSSHKDNKRGKGTLGVIEAKTEHGLTFGVGSGYDQATRDELWAIRDELPGQLVKVKFFPSGAKERPRFPVFLGIRDPIDL